MSTKVFYFSGSGNSLAIARVIADGVGDAEIAPMAKYPDGYTGGNEERIGLITPVYAWGTPRMVDDFARRLKPKKGQYVFAVADCGGTQGKTLVQLRNRLRANGSGLDAGFAVRGDFFAQLPGMRTSGIIRFIRRIAKRMPVRFGDRSNEIVRTVSDKAEHKPETNNWPVNLIGSLIHGGAMRMFNKIDADFSVGDACTSCGTCARVCPRENVKLVDGKPTWHHDCESCFACFLWCPEKAIAFKGFPPNEPTHHPDIIVVDMLLR